MRTTILRAILLGGLSASATLPGCATDPGDSAQPDIMGEIGLEVKLAPGLTLDSVSYTITGPIGFSRTGSIDVGNSTTVSAIVGRIPFGVGYQITLRGASPDGSAVCMGTATFDIDGPGTKPVALHMTCELQPTTGSILINGSLNICPKIEGIDVSPAEVIFGGAISLQAAASDLDRAPAPLGFTWTATSGTFSNASTTGPTWTCNKVGRTTLTFAASDGDPACASSRSVDVVCSEPPSESPIKHVIVLIGENRTFDHTFGTYIPVPGQTVANLVSKGIVNADGSPGPNFALAAQSEAAAQGAFFIAPDEKTRYAVLPGPSTSGAPSAQRTTAPPFQTVDQARAETDMAPEDLILLTTGNFVPPTTQRSIGDSLNEKGISWRFYGGGFNRGTGFCQICNPFEYQTQVMADPAARAEHIKDTVDMFADIANGTLPSVSFAHPDGALDGHPSSSKLGLFESYVKNILVKLDANPALRASTAVIITFDEGGGYYDSGFIQPVDFFGDGPRIPLIVVSPFSRGGKIDHSYADHVSILKFVERNWKLAPITGRSRDNLPNPVSSANNPYVPVNMPALTDLFDLFDFNQ